MTAIDLTYDRARELLAYDPETGALRWRVDHFAPDGRRVRRSAGMVAGTVVGAHRRNLYRHIKIDRRHYKAHRLAWLLVTGSWPEIDIDHRDGDGLNNSWINLREATDSENCANRRLSRRSRSGVKGVSWDASSRKWKATIMAEGKNRHLGVFVEKADAAAAYEAAAIQHFGEFARTK